jgi:hypothetical protein
MAAAPAWITLEPPAVKELYVGRLGGIDSRSAAEAVVGSLLLASAGVVTGSLDGFPALHRWLPPP